MLKSYNKASAWLFGECCQDPLVDSHHRLPSARQSQGYVQQPVLNHRDCHLGQGVRTGENGPETTGDRATTTHSKSGCQ